MKINFRQLQLPELVPARADQLKILSGFYGQDQALNPPKIPDGVPNIPTNLPRNINEIINDIEYENCQNISTIEWIYCLYKKSEWDQLNLQKSQITSQLIWKYAHSKDSLKQLLFWNLISSISNQKISVNFPRSLVDTFSCHFIPQTEKDKNIRIIINALISTSPQNKIGQISYQSLLTPYQLFLQHQLPTKISTIKESLEYTVLHFIEAIIKDVKSITEKQIIWLLNCLQEMDRRQQLKSVESILIEVSPDIGGQYPRLVNWLKQNYSLAVNNSRWNELSSQAKIALQKWIGAVNYNDFSSLVDLTVQYIEQESINLDRRSKEKLNKSKDQLLARRIFWSHYSERFTRIRILLPQSFLSHNNFEYQEVTTLKEDGSEPTEICIFDFDDYFVVEFFRGIGSETRLLKYSKDVNDLLFLNSQLSVKKIRALGGEAHDHCYLWQISCNHLLLRKNIKPNEGLREFKRLDTRRNKIVVDSYDSRFGLVYPSLESQHKREEQVEDWRKTLERLEKEASMSLLFDTI